MMKVSDVKHTFSSDQIGKFPECSSHGYKYQMVQHEIGSNLAWVNPCPIGQNKQ